MLTIDAQVHAYERNHPGRPWLSRGRRAQEWHARERARQIRFLMARGYPVSVAVKIVRTAASEPATE